MNEKIDISAEKKIIRPEWSVEIPKEETAEAARALGKAMARDRTEDTLKILHDPAVLHSFIIRRGVNCEYHRLLGDSLRYLVQKKFGENISFDNISSDELIGLVKENGLEAWLIKLQAAAYHSRDDKTTNKIVTAITEHENTFNDKILAAEALHNMATYKISGDNNNKLGTSYNKAALEKAGGGDANLITKIRFGLTFSKDERLTPSERAKSYGEYAEAFESAGNRPDAGRAKIERARALFEKAAWQSVSQPDEAERNHKQAEELAEETLKYARSLPYPNLELLSLWTLAHIKFNRGKHDQGAGYKAEALRIKTLFNYKSDLPKFRLPLKAVK